MKYFGVFLVILSIFSSPLHAQDLDEALRLYHEKRYADALPLLETALQSKKKDVVKRRAEIYPLLGDIYFSSYHFEKAAKAYSDYVDLLLEENQIERADSIQILIDRAERAARMLSRCEDIQFIDSVVVDKKQFLDAYWMSQESGSLHNINGNVFYENALQKKRYFSEKQPDNTRKLFSEIRLQGEWTDKRAIELPNDSMADNNFPFVLPDGLTLYFASTDKTSIGGYDLYLTRYHLNNETWLVPNQLAMPFNSIYNDYLLAIDEFHQIGYFASDRFQPENKVIVYTFIPNEELVFLETENEIKRINRAQITAISDTWKGNIDYFSLLNRYQQTILSEQKTLQPDFEFIIDDNRSYRSLLNFKQAAALQAFRKYQDITNDIHLINSDLDKLQQKYSISKIKEKKELADLILQNEEKLQTLYRQQALFLKNARNFEIK